MDECAEIQQLRKEISALTQDKRKLELDAKRREEAMQRALDKATEGVRKFVCEALIEREFHR